MVTRYFFLLFISVAFFSCDSEDKQAHENKAPSAESKLGKQVKISILWDLSDRISPSIHNEIPSNADRDVAIIKYFAEILKADMDRKGAFFAKGKLKVFFSPVPHDADINALAAKLDVDLSNKDVKTKKGIYDSMAGDFERTAKKITEVTIKTSKWEGSDVYRFFKNDVKDYCTSKDSSYRNILVILTDGYIYHPQSKVKNGNKSEYILADNLKLLGLRDNINYKSVFESKHCGLIATRNDLDNLEVLVLEVNSEANHKNDEDIIKLYLQDWFKQMNVKNYEVYNTDLPDNTKKRITNFLQAQ